MSLLAAVWTSIAVVALLLSERAGSRPSVWLAKPAASLGFVAIAWLQRNDADLRSQLVFAAACTCALGDVLLIPVGRGAVFLAGVGAFALGHALYASAFWITRPWVSATMVAAFAMLVVAWLTLRWLDPFLDRPLYFAVRGYIAIISLMVALAIGSSAATGDVRIAIGAVAFAASDLSVARDRFVREGFENLVWGLPLYYGAQLLLTWG